MSTKLWRCTARQSTPRGRRHRTPDARCTPRFLRRVGRTRHVRWPRTSAIHDLGWATSPQWPRTSNSSATVEQAHRWAAMGVNQLDLGGADVIEDHEVITLLNVRRLIRQGLGFPPDELDETGP